MDSRELGVFGKIPEKYVSWFLENSGTTFINDRWVVCGNADSVVRLSQNGRKIYKINTFEARYDDSKNYIKSKMLDGESYDLSNEYIFELMQEGRVVIPYKYQGKAMERTIVI